MIKTILITFLVINILFLDFILLLCLIVGGNDEGRRNWKSIEPYKIYFAQM